MGRDARQLLADWLPAVAVMAAIFWFSSRSQLPVLGPDHGELDFPIKKLAHVVAYSALAMAYLWGVRLARRPYGLAFLLSVLYAAGDEIHQSMVPFRGASSMDVVLDALAAAIALWTARRVGERRGRSGKRRKVWT